MKENKSLVELNHELKQQVNNRQKDEETNKKGFVVMFIIAIVAVIAGAVLGRLM